MNGPRMALASRPQKRAVTTPKSIPAPIGGWVTAQNIAASQDGTCLVLDNWFPTTTGVRLRGGNVKVATLGDGPVESFIGYLGAATERFAAFDGGIYDFTIVVDPDTPLTPVVTGQTANYYAHVNFSTTGGDFLYAVNGADPALLYDGTDWTPIDDVSTPAITGADTSSFSHVNVYRNRLYFVSNIENAVYYLPVDSIGGAASSLSLAGIFRKGGKPYFTVTWASESGSSTLNDYLVVISTQGEAAIFQGSFPGGDDWTVAGVVDISPPLGINGWMKAGGDIVVATERGMVPISAARVKDPAALSLDAVSRRIEPTWTAEVRARRNLPWEIAKWDGKSAFYVNTPITNALNSPITFVGNLQTGALSRYTGWDTRCLLVSGDQMYFGCNDGTIRQAEVSGSDNGMIYNCEFALAWDHLGIPAYYKSLRLVKAEFITDIAFNVRLSASADYFQSFPVAPNVLADASPSSLWDVGLWDVAVWDDGLVPVTRFTRWRSIGRSGEVFCLQGQVAMNNARAPNSELAILHVMYETGGIVV